MDHFAGLDVSVKETSVCTVDDTGRIIREVKVASEPEALLEVLRNPAWHFKRIGLEAGPLLVHAARGPALATAKARGAMQRQVRAVALQPGLGPVPCPSHSGRFRSLADMDRQAKRRDRSKMTLNRHNGNILLRCTCALHRPMMC
jgi:hypothetical protein